MVISVTYSNLKKRGVTMNTEPRIETFSIKLVGIQGIINGDQDIRQGTSKHWERVFNRLEEVKNRSKSQRRIGYWLSIDGVNRVLFAGIEVDSFEGMKEDLDEGFIFWDVGELTVAIWEEKNSDTGSIVEKSVGYSWLEKSGYDFDRRFIGDFEVNNDRFNDKDFHEIWIPIIEK